MRRPARMRGLTRDGGAHATGSPVAPGACRTSRRVTPEPRAGEEEFRDLQARVEIRIALTVRSSDPAIEAPGDSILMQETPGVKAE